MTSIRLDDAFRGEPVHYVADRKADDVRIGTRDPLHQKSADSLDSVCARFVHGFARPDVGLDFRFRKPFELHLRDNRAGSANVLFCIHQAHAGDDLVNPAAQAFEHLPGGRTVRRLPKDASVEDHYGVGSQHPAVRKQARNRNRFPGCPFLGRIGRAGEGIPGFFLVAGMDFEFESYRLEQAFAPRGFGGQDKRPDCSKHATSRSVIGG